MQSRVSKGVGEVCGGRASGSVVFYGRPKIPRDIDDREVFTPSGLVGPQP